MQVSKKRTATDEVLAVYYWEIVKVLRDLDKRAYIDELVEETGYSIGQIKKAVQWGRREFDKGHIKITDYVMASGTGYFLPTRGREVVAYVVQNTKDILSRSRTQKPIYEYAMAHWKEELQEAFAEKSQDGDIINDVMTPWEVFNSIINKED